MKRKHWLLVFAQNTPFLPFLPMGTEVIRIAFIQKLFANLFWQVNAQVVDHHFIALQ